MAHQMPPAIQAEIRALPGNLVCVDCGQKSPQWASVSFGTLMCLECSGQHRGLGVHISFVRSVTMDSWSEKQITSMRLGGNQKLLDWFAAKGVDKSLSIKDKYNTDAAELYRLRLTAMRDGAEPPETLPPRPPPAASRPPIDQRPLESISSHPLPGSARAGMGAGAGASPGLGMEAFPPAPSLAEVSQQVDEVAKAAAESLGSLATAFSAWTVTAQERLREAKLGERIQATAQTVVDPATLTKVQESANEGWTALAAGAASLTTSASDWFSKLPALPVAGAGAEEPPRDASFSASGRAPSPAASSSFVAAPAPGVAPGVVTMAAPVAAPLAAAEPQPPKLSDEEWARQNGVNLASGVASGSASKAKPKPADASPAGEGDGDFFKAMGV